MKQKVELTPQILRMYVGRDCQVTHNVIYETSQIDEVLLIAHNAKNAKVIPHLRPLSSITEDEANEFWKVSNVGDFAPNPIDGIDQDTPLQWFEAFYSRWGVLHTVYTAPEFLYLLSKGFDLFGLIEAGLAKEVDK